MNKPNLYVGVLQNVFIFQQLHIEEAFLRNDHHNICLINVGSDPALVLGISSKIEEVVYTEQIEKRPIPIIRRFTGGGSVVIDHNTIFVTLICDPCAISVDPFPSTVHQFMADVYSKVFFDCPFRFVENDYLLFDKKVGGNAQYFKKDRWLHHTSFLWDWDKKYMKYLKFPPKTPKYRKHREHKTFLTKLKDFLPDRNTVIQRITKVLSEYFAISPLSQKQIEDKKNRVMYKSTKIESVLN